MNYYYIYTYHEKSHRQILPPPLTVEDSMDNVSLIPYYHPAATFNFEGRQEEQVCGLLQLLPHSPLQASAAPSTQISTEVVIARLLIEFQL